MIKHFMAIDNVCAWPDNMIVLPNGDLAVAIWNQPCHQKWEGDVEFWTSSDGGESWTLRGPVTRREPDTIRCDRAFGLTENGDLVALVGGWSNKPVKNKVRNAPFRSELLNPWICRSTDGGATWKREGELPPADSGVNVAFGGIHIGPDDTLLTAVYRHQVNEVVILASEDNGESWRQKSLICDDADHSETSILRVGDGRWLAASRTGKSSSRLDLFVSEDDCQTWRLGQPLTGPHMCPGHLARLEDGRILLTYGIRITGCRGVGVRFSEDGGVTWGKPITLVQFGPTTDSGYPSSVQRRDGAIVTAWYAKGTVMHARYHMGVTCWTPDDPRLIHGAMSVEEGM